MVVTRVVMTGSIGLVAALLLALLMQGTSAQAGDPVPGLDITIEQIPGGAVQRRTATLLGLTDSYTVELSRTARTRFDISKALIDRAAVLIKEGSYAEAARLANSGSELNQRMLLELKAAASIHQLYISSLTQRSSVACEDAQLFTADYNSSRSNTSTSLFLADPPSVDPGEAGAACPSTTDETKESVAGATG